MIHAISSTQANQSRKRLMHGDIEYYRTEYFRPSGVALDATLDEVPLHVRGPQAFIVEQLPGSVVGSHFHISNQFQVIVKGSGMLGKHTVRPIAVHYAGGYTGYGPITAGDEGLAYLTLRAQFNAGPNFLPESRAKLKDVTRQFTLADDVTVSDAAQLSARQGTVLETIIEPYANGLAGYIARLEPHGTLAAPDPSSGGGQNWVVAAGELVFGGEPFPPLSCIFVGPGDTGLTLEAGAAGVEVLVLQYPQDCEAAPRVRAS